MVVGRCCSRTFPPTLTHPEIEMLTGVPYDGRIPWQVPYLYYNFLFYWDADLMGWDLIYLDGTGNA